MNIKLYNLGINNQTQDRLFYNSIALRDSDFDSKVASSLEASNFERINDLTFSIDVYDLAFDPEATFDYAVYNGYYLFIDSAIEKNTTTTRMIMTLDTLNMYFRGDNLDPNKQVYVKRSHVDRFKEISTGVYKFDFDNDELLIKEDINIDPSVYDPDAVFMKEPDNNALDNLKWLCITTSDKGDLIQFQLDPTNNDIIELPLKTFYIPLIGGSVQFRDPTSKVVYGSGLISSIMGNVNTNAIIDVKILPYLGVKTLDVFDQLEILYEGGFVYVDVPSGYTALLDSAESDTMMMTLMIHGIMLILLLLIPV